MNQYKDIQRVGAEQRGMPFDVLMKTTSGLRYDK